MGRFGYNHRKKKCFFNTDVNYNQHHYRHGYVTQRRTSEISKYYQEWLKIILIGMFLGVLFSSLFISYRTQLRY